MALALTIRTILQYVLLANAQADSSEPKSAAELRDEVVRNYHLRVQEKAKQAEQAKRNGTATESPAVEVTAQMAQNFARLAQDIADRKAGKRPASASPQTPSPATPVSGKEMTSPVGIWRHIYAIDTKQEFYINSVTREIRLQPPSPAIQQQNPANRYDGISDPVISAVSSSDGIAGATPNSASSAELVRSTPSKRQQNAKVKRAIAGEFFSPMSSSTAGTDSPRTRSRLSSDSATSTRVEGGHTSGRGVSSTSSSPAKPAAPIVVDGDNGFGGDTPETAIDVNLDNQGGEACESLAAVADLAAPSVDDEEKKWSCPRCTLVNDPTCVDCEACGYENTALQPPRKRQRKKLQFQSKLSLR